MSKETKEASEGGEPKINIDIDPSVSTKWEIVSNEEIIEKTNWICLNYQNEHRLHLLDFGAGGILEGKKVLKPDCLSFLIVRGVHALGMNCIPIDIVLNWLPPSCSAFDRAKSTFHVEHVVSHLSMDHFFIIEINNLSQLEPDFIERKIRKATNITGGRFAFDGNTVTLRRKRQNSMIMLKRREEVKNQNKVHDKQREINVFQEIYATEEAYVNQMKEFYDYYVVPMKPVNLAFYSMLATNVKLILDINTPFLEDMKKCSFQTTTEEDEHIEDEEVGGEKDETTISDMMKVKNVAKLVELLVSQCPIFKLYLPYINVYTKMVTMAKDLMLENEAFETFCRTTKKKLEEKESRNTDIYGFLIMPIQRIPRYQLLMRELHRKTEPTDPNYTSIQEGLAKVGEVARYIDAKKAENENAQKTIELSQKYKIKDLVDLHRKMKRSINCKLVLGGKGRAAQLYIFNDLLLICGYHPKKFVRVEFGSVDNRCYPSEKEEKVLVMETGRKQHMIELKRREVRDLCVEYIQTVLTVQSSQHALDQRFQGRTVYQSSLQKEGGGTFSYNMKKRWHVLTTDYKMKYYDTPGGKFKGSYSLFNSTVGKGKDTTKRKKAGLARLIAGTKSIDLKAISNLEKKECWFYITTPKRTYFLLAPDVVVLDTWVRVLSLIGCKRKDVLDFEESQWQDREMEKIKSRGAVGASRKLGEDDFDLPDMFGEKSKKDDDDFELPTNMFAANDDVEEKKIEEEEVEGEEVSNKIKVETKNSSLSVNLEVKESEKVNEELQKQDESEEIESEEEVLPEEEEEKEKEGKLMEEKKEEQLQQQKEEAMKIEDQQEIQQIQQGESSSSASSDDALVVMEKAIEELSTTSRY